MNKTQCWACKEEFEYDGEKYRDVNCPHCDVQNSIMNSEKPDWLPPNGYPTTTEGEWLNEGEGEMAKPPKHENKEFEKVKIAELLPGVIETINYDKEHKFKGFQGKEDTIQPAVRFKFMLDGYQYPHYSRWYKFTYGEKSNLYKIFLTKLVENAQPDMDFDLDILKGLRVKTLWNDNGDFQNLENIFPEGQRVKASDPVSQEEPEETPQEDS